jgi:hypothetical protein
MPPAGNQLYKFDVRLIGRQKRAKLQVPGLALAAPI